MTSCTRLLWLIILPFVLFLNSAHADTSVTDVEARIINGVDADAGDHDYFVALLYKFQWANGYNYWTFCGGTHLGNGTIVTAAHCVDGTSSTPLYVLIGNNSADMESEFCLVEGSFNSDNYCVPESESTEDYKQTGYVNYTGDEASLIEVTFGDFIVHQGYREFYLGHDIALLQLGSDIRNSSLDLPTDDLFPILAGSGTANNVMVIGHGDIISDTDTSTFNGSPQLQEATLTALTDTFCRGIFADYNDESMVCATDYGTSIQDSCQGDSGGPLFDPVTQTLLGIVSYGPTQCASFTTPYAVYTDVYNYVDWINSGGEEPLSYKSYGENIRLLNETGSLGWLSLVLLPLMFFRKR